MNIHTEVADRTLNTKNKSKGLIVLGTKLLKEGRLESYAKRVRYISAPSQTNVYTKTSTLPLTPPQTPHCVPSDFSPLFLSLRILRHPFLRRM